MPQPLTALLPFRRGVPPDTAPSVMQASRLSGGDQIPALRCLRTARSPRRLDPRRLPSRRDSGDGRDRKSTRLNSSHLVISYAVFCLKKKKKDIYNLM